MPWKNYDFNLVAGKLLLIISIICNLHGAHSDDASTPISQIKFNSTIEEEDEDGEEIKSNDPFVNQMRFYTVSKIYPN